MHCGHIAARTGDTEEGAHLMPPGQALKFWAIVRAKHAKASTTKREPLIALVGCGRHCRPRRHRHWPPNIQFAARGEGWTRVACTLHARRRRLRRWSRFLSDTGHAFFPFGLPCSAVQFDVRVRGRAIGHGRALDLGGAPATRRSRWAGFFSFAETTTPRANTAGSEPATT